MKHFMTCTGLARYVCEREKGEKEGKTHRSVFYCDCIKDRSQEEKDFAAHMEPLAATAAAAAAAAAATLRINFIFARAFRTELFPTARMMHAIKSTYF